MIKIKIKECIGMRKKNHIQSKMIIKRNTQLKLPSIEYPLTVTITSQSILPKSAPMPLLFMI